MHFLLFSALYAYYGSRKRIRELLDKNGHDVVVITYEGPLNPFAIALRNTARIPTIMKEATSVDAIITTDPPSTLLLLPFAIHKPTIIFKTEWWETWGTEIVSPLYAAALKAGLAAESLISKQVFYIRVSEHIPPKGAPVLENIYKGPYEPSDGNPHSLIYTGSLNTVRAWKARRMLELGQMMEKVGGPWTLDVWASFHEDPSHIKTHFGPHTRLHLSSYWPHSKLMDALSHAGIGVLFFSQHPQYENTTPNKISEYLSRGLPIIVNVNKYAQELIERFGCGVFLKEFNLNNFRQALHEVEQNYDEMREGARRAYAYLQRRLKKQEREVMKRIEKYVEDYNASD